MMTALTTQDFADALTTNLNASWRQIRTDDEARRDKDIKKCEDKLEKKEKYWVEKLEQKDNVCNEKLEQKDKMCNEKLEKMKQENEEKLEKMKQENEEKLEKMKQENEKKLQKMKQWNVQKLNNTRQECEETFEKKIENIKQELKEKVDKKDKECEEYTNAQVVKNQKVQSWRKTYTEKFMSSGCDNPQVIATLAKDMGNTRFMTGDIVQDRVKLIMVNDWECATFCKRCAQVKENMEKINNKRTHDQIHSDTGASNQ